ncbi:helix-turn-helix domain-containing protein [Acinetobacter sp. GXMZU3951]
MSSNESNVQHECVKFQHVQELGGLELLNASYVEKQFSKHVHEGYCIGVIEEGAQSFYRTGALHVAPKGDIILVNADEVHTGSSAVETGWRYRAIYPTPEMLKEVSQDFFQHSGTVPWFPQAVLHDEGLAQQLRVLFDLLEQEDNLLFKQSLYISTLAYLMSRHSRKPVIDTRLPEVHSRILMIKDLLASAPEKEYSLNELAETVGLSPWHFLRQFKKYTGLPPHAWLVQFRLLKAKQLLKQGEHIALVADLCGFSDQSHFNRHFKKAMGVTPLQYVMSLR